MVSIVRFIENLSSQSSLHTHHTALCALAIEAATQTLVKWISEIETQQNANGVDGAVDANTGSGHCC